MRLALAQTGLAGVYFIDLKGESDHLYEGYLREAILLSLAGLAAILGLLFVATRSPGRVFRIAAPLVVAVAVIIAGLALAGQQLTILHLVGMLLVVAIGSNYALFFDQGAVEGGMSPRVLASLVVAVSTTVAGFGILAFSSVPVLNAIGCHGRSGRDAGLGLFRHPDAADMTVLPPTHAPPPMAPHAAVAGDLRAARRGLGVACDAAGVVALGGGCAGRQPSGPDRRRSLAA